jgi:hypothetical protein
MGLEAVRALRGLPAIMPGSPGGKPGHPSTAHASSAAVLMLHRRCPVRNHFQNPSGQAGALVASGTALALFYCITQTPTITYPPPPPAQPPLAWALQRRFSRRQQTGIFRGPWCCRSFTGYSSARWQDTTLSPGPCDTCPHRRCTVFVCALAEQQRLC